MLIVFKKMINSTNVYRAILCVFYSQRLKVVILIFAFPVRKYYDSILVLVHKMVVKGILAASYV